MKHFYFLLFMFVSLTTNAQLQTGDIAFTGYFADNPDAFSFVTFVDIPANTQIEFTDNGWLAAGGFGTNEGVVTWTSPASITSAGSEIIVSGLAMGTVNIGSLNTNSMAFSATGDQLFAYDPANIPDATDDSGFYAGIHANGTWDADRTNSNTSAQPNALIGFSLDGITADNAVYDCSTISGTASQIRDAIHTLANWNTSNTAGNLTLPSCNFMQTLSTETFNTIEFSIFPNPTSTGFVNIKTTNSSATTEVSVYNVLGKEVINTVLKSNRLNVSSLNVGVYILQLNQNGATATKKLVIK